MDIAAGDTLASALLSEVHMERSSRKSRKNDENRREYLRRTQLHPDMTLLKAQ